MSPTQRALKDLKDLGFTVAIVERWNPHVKIRQDLFGFADLLAVREGVGIVAIQVTSGSNHAARSTKIKSEPRAYTWTAAGGKIEVWSYALRGAAGKRKKYELRREDVVLPYISGTQQ